MAQQFGNPIAFIAGRSRRGHARRAPPPRTRPPSDHRGKPQVAGGVQPIARRHHQDRGKSIRRLRRGFPPWPSETPVARTTSKRGPAAAGRPRQARAASGSSSPAARETQRRRACDRMPPPPRRSHRGSRDRAQARAATHSDRAQCRRRNRQSFGRPGGRDLDHREGRQPPAEARSAASRMPYSRCGARTFAAASGRRQTARSR